MPRLDQDVTLQALVAGELPAEVVFDPITDSDSTGSCLGCAYSTVGALALMLAMYTAAVRYQWEWGERFFASAGYGGVALAVVIGTLLLFTAVEMCSFKEVYVLLTDPVRLELRRHRWRTSLLVRSWPVEKLQKFSLDESVDDDPSAVSSLYVSLVGEEPIRLLEPSYPREFVEQVERELSALCQLPSTTRRL